MLNTQILAQALGIISSAIAICSYQFKRKWQILGLSAVANTLTGLNFLLIGNAGVMTANCFVAALQCAINMLRSYLGKKDAGTLEKLIVFAVFLAIGIVRYNSLLDLLPLASTVFFVLSTFQRSEQSIRVMLFFNNLILLVYSLIMGSSVLFGYVFSIVSIVLAYIRERKVCEKI